jgi:uncharacterized protein YdaU (DUF1376 family)
MAGSSWFPMFGRDFLAATLGWSAEERGHYATLLITQWEQDGLPDEMKRLELISPGVGKCWKLIQTKFPRAKDGKLRNVRLEHERHLSHERSERARQSASKRWAKATEKGADPDDSSDSGCDGICDRICDSTCSSDASMSMSYSPPPPTTPSADFGDDWARLREAWNAAWDRKRQWRSIEPPPEAVARLAEPGWLEEALRSIPEVKGGMCSGFKTPPTLRQFCGRDDVRGSWVSRMLGGEFTDQREVVAPVERRNHQPGGLEGRRTAEEAASEWTRGANDPERQRARQAYLDAKAAKAANRPPPPPPAEVPDEFDLERDRVALVAQLRKQGVA